MDTINSLAVNTKYNKNELIDLFENMMKKSNFTILNSVKSDNYYECSVRSYYNKYYLRVVIKNISFSGWRDKDNIRRIQTPNPSSYLIESKKDQTFLLCGVTQYNGKNIFCFFNSYDYVSHRTLRSCYVTTQTIEKGYSQGLFFDDRGSNAVWVCDEEHFDLLLRNFILDNYKGCAI